MRRDNFVQDGIQEIISKTLCLCFLIVVSGYLGQGMFFIPELKEEKYKQILTTADLVNCVSLI